MFRRYQWGPVTCAVSDSFNQSQWSMWQWKIDAYETSSEEDVSCASLVISGPQSVEDASYSDKLCDERSGFYSRQVFLQKDGSMLWRLIETRTADVKLLYRVGADWTSITLLQDNTQTAGQAAFEYMSRMAVYSSVLLGVTSFHGALMEHEGKGFIIAAPSGTGKTTHARLWRDSFGSVIINGDNASCYQKDGKWMGFGIPWCGTSGENLNREVCVDALVILEQSEINAVEKLDGMEAFTEALPILQCPVWDKQVSEKALNGLESFLSEIPVYRLKCRPDKEAAQTLKNALGI